MYIVTNPYKPPIKISPPPTQFTSYGCTYNNSKAIASFQNVFNVNSCYASCDSGGYNFFYLNYYGCNCIMIQKNISYPSAIYDPNNIICNLKNSSFCLPKCDYHGDSSGFFANSYLISLISSPSILIPNLTIPNNTDITYS